MRKNYLSRFVDRNLEGAAYGSYGAPVGGAAGVLATFYGAYEVGTAINDALGVDANLGRALIDASAILLSSPIAFLAAYGGAFIWSRNWHDYWHSYSRSC